jgi:murein DD-endopeptidase MepM/ murein hydrolase activator NlpD
MKLTGLFLIALLALGCTANAQGTKLLTPPISLPKSVDQGQLVVGHVMHADKVTMRDIPEENVTGNDLPEVELKAAADGKVVFGVGRDETGLKRITIKYKNGETTAFNILIKPRQFKIEDIKGVPQDTVTPSPEIAARIEREQAEVVAARLRFDDRQDFATDFIWPVEGRISGVYGSQRIYNGTPKSWHSGLDVAAKQGTPIKAPAAGIITFAKPDLYLTGGTLLIDHGMGVSSNFLHLSRLDVKVGDRVEKGQVIGLVGMTGRATGPHMHWGMNWLKVRIDPQLLLPAKP